MSDEKLPEQRGVAQVTRRSVLQGTGVLVAVALTGCGDDAGGDGSGGPGAGGPGGGGGAGGSTGTNQPPVWQEIPEQVWMVGIPVYLDFALYCSDAEGAALTFTLDNPLPPGLALNGSVISGVPTTEFPTTPFVITADDSA